MRKNVKNDKVIKAITIGLAAMIAVTSAPITAYAYETDTDTDNNTNETSGENTSSEQSESSQNESQSASEASEIIESAVEIVGESTESAPVTEAIAAPEACLPAVESAIDAVTAIPEAEAVLVNLANAQNELEEAKDALEIAEAGIDAVVEMQELGSAYNVNAITAKGELDRASDSLKEFNDADSEANVDSESAIADAEVANTSDSREEAYAAKDQAIENLANAEAGLEAATEAYNMASEAVDSAQAAYDAAVEERDAVAAKLAEAKSAVSDAKSNATAANEQLKAAQAKMDRLNDKVEKLAESQDQLKAIRDQYYAMVVQYYGTGAAFNDDGTVNVEESFKKLSVTTADSKAKGPGNEVYLLGRDLLKKLVEYKIQLNDNVDLSTFSFGAVGTEETAVEGTVFTSDSKTPSGAYRDQVAVNRTRKNVNGEDVAPGNTYTYNWVNRSKINDGGRSNAVLVTYKDKEGNLHEEYYNYVFKSSAYDKGDMTDEEYKKDLENGFFYLAQVEKDENGNWSVSKDTDENNMDQYANVIERLKETAEAVQVLDEYEKAKKAVDDAQSLVDTLEEKLKELKDVQIDDSQVKALEGMLENAKTMLEDAGEKKEALEDKVEEARKAVEAIDLSRFDVTSAADEDTADDEADDDTTATPSAVVNPAGVTVTVPGLGIAPIVLPAAPAAVAQAGASESTPAGGVLGARVAEDLEERVFGGKLEEGAEEDFVIAPNTDLVEEVFGMDDNETGRKLVKIEDNAVPLAAMPEEDGVKMNWWWLLIILLLGATGKKMYDEHQKKVAAREEANR
ncbi:MAG: hypothetical protein E7298_01420 [Lachnospiraceae bacterium]|jgi:hypothetical protein|nr:hypothetical protein [Lachnospiraceae bacterium]